MRIIENVIFRTPLFPVSYITNPVSLKYIHNSKEFNEAAYLASPVFYKELGKYKANLIKDEKKIQQSLYKYSSRASSRCTPFGLFAGLSIGKWGNSNTIILNSDLKQALNRKTRLDMNVLCILVYELAKEPFIKPYIKFYPNNSIYTIGDFYRYVEYYFYGSKRVHRLSKVDYSDYLKIVFEKSSYGMCIDELVNVLVNEGIDSEEAIEVIDELINMQLLVSELEPTVTGNDFFDAILNVLQIIFAAHSDEKLAETIEKLFEIKKLINKLDTNKVNDVENYQPILEKLKTILPHINETNIVQTDLFKNVEEAILNKEIQQNILHALKFLNKITPEYTNPKLDSFKRKFQDRYQEAEILLLKALDTETGLGYPSNNGDEGVNDLIDDIRIYRNTGRGSNINWNSLQTTLFQILIKAEKENKYCVELTDDDFKGIDYTTKGLPHSLSIMFKVINTETNTISIENFGGSSAVNLLGRFAYGDETLLETIKEITTHEEEQAKGKILAEIAHLPENRVGNVVARPVIRNYEIPYLAKPGVNEEYQLAASDLYISVRNNKIVLRSKKLNKEIIPRLGNAHNFSFNSLPVYHFLCDLQLQYFSKPFLSFNWGILSSQFIFLPRVQYKNVIISPAKWQFAKNDLEQLVKKKNDEETLSVFYLFKEKHQLPDLFVLAEGDNELLIDTKQEIAIYAFVDAIKKKENIIVEEFLFDLEKPLVKDEEGLAYTNECIAVVLNDENKIFDSQILKGKQNKTQRHFTIGSEWLYYKIYSGVKTADNILKEKINNITEVLLKEKIIDKWFFIRYADPETHIRFRLHIKNLSKYGEVLSIIKLEFDELIESSLIFKIQTDQYDRELERYGDDTIELSENLFYFDSVCCVKALTLFANEPTRWQYALKATDELLNDFEFDLEEKYNLMAQLNQTFFREHGGKKELKIQLDNKFRKIKDKVKHVLKELDKDDEIQPFAIILNERSILNKETIKQLLILKDSNSISININELLSSYLHMMFNRIFSSKQRTNEFVIYNMLSKYYKSLIVAEKKMQFVP